VMAASGEPQAPAKPVEYARVAGDVVLELRQPARLHVVVAAGCRDQSCPLKRAWEDDVVVADGGTGFYVPIPKAKAFGKQTFTAAIAESGALTSVDYLGNTGAGAAVNVIGQAASTVAGETA